ncbi:glmZ(sRNA)-inactivating NTPase [Photobacterium damselae subsp. piscicida]|uniref:GlmZ(SRNA)-inactivating NTPase n=1 Tax=Photobacterium damsela subsp. piscicida TaxID=38294 RepID=A0A1V1V658_PHODP|nr:RNase adapter RapZ [Photobacterium damselae]MBE8128269.1 RNase adapter RapZ [Photobacterium damselae subsp. piscicida]PSV78384.1 RNase adapter RapZ [Photobacterium damselae]PSW80931.1 RNase adapter RapZ [Photobacterium damselae]QOD52985.1 RNase adapter RapZ [Photobacterium damselae subsp. piscicida]QOD56826.1 RNase adapter RapZ [Photobacterium damselae subsp. piscicida]
MRLMVVSGRSGSGKSVALRVLEDLGYYCVDNLPVNLLTQFIETIGDEQQDVAVSLDVRNMPSDTQALEMILNDLSNKVDLNILFLDADNKELVKRYSETRRLHPLSRDNMSLEQAILSESKIMEVIKERADLVVDTTGKSIHDLSETVRSRVLGRESRELILVFESFGFKYGLPTDADYVFDVRFLPNPHWVPELKPQTGLDEGVKTFLASHAEVNQLIYQVRNFIETWLPMLEKNNRSYVTVAIGCTGGQHRSVYIAQQLAEYFQHSGQQIRIRHRTLEGKK